LCAFAAIEGHYTCHTKSVITKPQNVLVMRDIMCSGYVAGANTQFFGAAKAKAGNTYTTSGPSWSDAVEAITDRLSFVDDASGEYESMLAFAVPFGDGAKRDQVISLSSRLLPWEVTRPENQWKGYFPGGKNGWDFYSNKLQLDQVHFGEDIRAAENMEFISQGSVNNSLCFLGPHRTYSPWSNTFYELTPGQGHFGPVHSAQTLNQLLYRDSVSVSIAPNPNPTLSRTPCRAMRGGVAERRLAFSSRATRWSASRRLRTRSSCSKRVAKR